MSRDEDDRSLTSASREDPNAGLALHWAAAYHPEWDTTPDAYVEHGVVGWGRSRRLARAADPAVMLKAYLGVQHNDPARWHMAGEPRTAFFLSLFLAGRTVSLRTFATLPAALAELRTFHARQVVRTRLGHGG